MDTAATVVRSELIITSPTASRTVVGIRAITSVPTAATAIGTAALTAVGHLVLLEELREVMPHREFPQGRAAVVSQGMAEALRPAAGDEAAAVVAITDSARAPDQAPGLGRRLSRSR
jgi:hypothetical protein